MSGEVTVRRGGPHDLVGAVITAAFADEGKQVALLWAEVEASDALRAGLLAERGGVVVGHIGLSHAWLDARRELVDVWLLGPLSVLPELARTVSSRRPCGLPGRRSRWSGSPVTRTG